MLQKVSDSPIRKCIKCNRKVERLLSSPAIQFKGTGWYVTDYARKSQEPTETKSEKKKSDSPSTSTSSEKSRKSGSSATASGTSKD
jgi:predicted nucleic acid-binding Zn ribbon protein